MPRMLESVYMKCSICIENKMCNLPFQNTRIRAQEVLEVIHTGVNGPDLTVGYKGEKYFVSFIDGFSGLSKVYCIKTKDEVYDCFREYMNEVQNLRGKKIKRLRCDNGREYLNSKIYRLARLKNFQINACSPYVHELNGTAERYNRTIMNAARCLLAEANVERKF